MMENFNTQTLDSIFARWIDTDSDYCNSECTDSELSDTAININNDCFCLRFINFLGKFCRKELCSVEDYFLDLLVHVR